MKMKNIRIASFMILAFFLMSGNNALMADPVSPSQARQVAQTFLREKGKTVKTIDMPRKGKSIAKQGNAAYYVFNNGDSDGFVIVSGDDRTEQVLGYSLDGHIDDGNIPENLKWVLEGYEIQISHLQEDSGGSIAQGLMNAPKALVSRPVHNSILLKTPYWDQGNNRMTPEIDGEHCPTGCVATAMAEIMAYHRWPQKSTEIPAYCWEEDYLEALPSTTFDWEKIDGDYCTDIELDKLMRYCGQGCEMDYGRYSSEASSENAFYAFKNYFHYSSQTLVYTQRELYTSQEWEDMLYHELALGRPVYMAGLSMFNLEAHAFVVDGYDGNHRFHLNLGWGGYPNGYYLLDVYDHGYDAQYTTDCEIIMGIAPETVGIVPEVFNPHPYSLAFYGTYLEHDEYQYAASEGFLSGVVGLHLKPRGFDMCYYNIALGLFKGETLIETTPEVREYVDGSNFIQHSSIDAPLQGIGKNLADGTYYLAGVYRRSTSDNWERLFAWEKDTLSLVISNGEAALESKELGQVLQVVSMDYPPKVTEGEDLTVTLRLRSTTEPSYTIPFVYNIDDNPTKFIRQVVDGAGETEIVLNIPTKNISVGRHQFYVKYHLFETYIPLGKGTFTVTEDTGLKDDIELVDYKVVNFDPEAQAIVNGYLNLEITLRNKGVSPRKFLLFDGDYINNPQYTLAPGETVTLSSHGRLSDWYYEIYDVGTMQQVAFSGAEGAVEIKGEKYPVRRGYRYWTADGICHYKVQNGKVKVPDDACAIQFKEMPGQVVPNANPNTIYHLPYQAACPAALKGKNVVIDSSDGVYPTNEFDDNGFEIERMDMEAECLRIDARYSMYLPFEFHAKKAFLDMVVNKGCNGKTGWTAFSMPFSPTSVTNTTDNKPLECFKSPLDTGKDFWIRQLGAVGKDTLTFRIATSIQANKPCLLGWPGEGTEGVTSLVGKSIEFAADDVDVKVSGNDVKTELYTWHSSNALGKVSGYVLNDKGDRFDKVSDKLVGPLTSYFTTNADESTGSSLQMAFSQMPVAIDSINFPDRRFRNWVSEYADTYSDGFLYEDEIGSLKKIDCYDWNSRYLINDVTGIEYFTELEGVNFNNNPLENANFTHNTKLKSIDVGDANLKQIDLSHLPLLEKLVCYRNYNMEFLDVSHNPKLQVLNGHDMRLSSLDVSRNTELYDLSCGYNLIRHLDISNNAKLKYFYCYNNPIKKINFANCPNISTLWIQKCQLLYVDLSMLANLKDLSASHLGSQQRSMPVVLLPEGWGIAITQNMDLSLVSDLMFDGKPCKVKGTTAKGRRYLIVSAATCDESEVVGKKVTYNYDTRAVTDTHLMDVTVTLSEKGTARPLGDVNNDGYASVADLMEIVSHILNTSTDNDEDIDEMDINDDCNVSINDVMQLVDIILEKDSTQP